MHFKAIFFFLKPILQQLPLPLSAVPFRRLISPNLSQKDLFLMLGLGDGFVFAAMIGTVAITLVCVIFGAINWNKGTGENK